MVLRGVLPSHAPRDSLYLVKVGGIFAGNLLLHESPYIFDWVQIRAVPKILMPRSACQFCVNRARWQYGGSEKKSVDIGFSHLVFDGLFSRRHNFLTAGPILAFFQSTAPSFHAL